MKENLKRLRIEANLTQTELAELLRVDQSAVSNWERGVNPPLRKYREELCRLYSCTEDELLDAKRGE